MKYESERLLKLPQVLEIIPVSKSTWWSWVAQSKAPAPVKLNSSTFWEYSKIMDFIASNSKK